MTHAEPSDKTSVPLSKPDIWWVLENGVWYPVVAKSFTVAREALRVRLGHEPDLSKLISPIENEKRKTRILKGYGVKCQT